MKMNVMDQIIQKVYIEGNKLLIDVMVGAGLALPTSNVMLTAYYKSTINDLLLVYTFSIDSIQREVLKTLEEVRNIMKGNWHSVSKNLRPADRYDENG